MYQEKLLHMDSRRHVQGCLEAAIFKRAKHLEQHLKQADASHQKSGSANQDIFTRGRAKGKTGQLEFQNKQ